jgi:hypothetical protein
MLAGGNEVKNLVGAHPTHSFLPSKIEAFGANTFKKQPKTIPPIETLSTHAKG